MRREPVFQFIFRVQFEGAGCAHAVVGLGDDGEAGPARKGADGVQSLRGLDLAGGGHFAEGVVFLHLGLLLDGVDVVGLDARIHVEIRAKARVLLEPVFVVGLYPVDASIFVGEPRHGAVHLVIIFQVADLIIILQRAAELVVEVAVGGVGNAEHIDPVTAQAGAEMAVCVREMRRNKNNIHKGIHLIFTTYLFHRAVGNLPGGAVEDAAAVLAEDISSVGEGIEMMVPAVGEDDVLEEPAAVEHVIAHLIIVRNDLDVRKSEAPQPAAV